MVDCDCAKRVCTGWFLHLDARNWFDIEQIDKDILRCNAPIRIPHRNRVKVRLQVSEEERVSEPPSDGVLIWCSTSEGINIDLTIGISAIFLLHVDIHIRTFGRFDFKAFKCPAPIFIFHFEDILSRSEVRYRREYRPISIQVKIQRTGPA